MNSMNIVAISDVHVKVPHDEADRLLMSFLNHPAVQDAQYVMLLGDIFDLMCGPHEEYLKMYSHVFGKLEELRKSGKKIHFIEGNHDVHLESLFEMFWPKREIVSSKDPFIETIEGKTYYFSHGDEHEIDNLTYHRYKRFIYSKPLRFIANHIMPFAVLNFVGERASKISRKKGYKKFDAELVRNRFRKGVETTTQGRYDFVIGGHSHVQDLYRIPGTNETYVNNGYALRSKTFISIRNHEVSFISLS